MEMEKDPKRKSKRDQSKNMEQASKIILWYDW
jgi:hypothetical protein